MMKAYLTCTLAAALAVLSTGCNRDSVKVYHVENDDATPVPPPVAAPAAMPAGLPAPDSSGQPQLKYALPDGWQEKTPTEMRVASFTVTGASNEIADVGIIPLPATGQEIQLVNMWRDQMQLPALTNEMDAEAVSVGDDSAKLFDIASAAPLIDGKFRARILVAMLTRGETSWFFKMTGDDSFVASQKEIFLQFLKSISFVENVPQVESSTMPGTSLGNQNSLVPNANTIVRDDSSIWTVPADWKQLPPSEFLLAEFSISGANGATAEVNVAELAGDGGGLLPNVNRWRGQLGLPPVTFIGTSAIIGGSNIQIVDFTGTDSKTGKPARLVGAIVPQNGQTWFYKLMGDPDIVAQQKDAFTKFIQSAKYPDDH